MRNPGIYILRNKVNGKCYVGKDSNLPARSKEHLRGRAQKCFAVYSAIKKYGAENFDVEIIPYPGISESALNAVEVWKIKQLGTRLPNGYNCTDGGEGSSGFKHSNESKRKISEAKKGTPCPEHVKHKLRNMKGENHPNYGKPRSPEVIRKMSDAATGRVHTEDSKRKMSMSKKGKKFTDEHKNNISQALTGKIRPKEVMKKITETKLLKRKKIYWMYIISLAMCWYEMYDAVMAQREEFFSKNIPNTSDAEQITLI